MWESTVGEGQNREPVGRAYIQGFPLFWRPSAGLSRSHYPRAKGRSPFLPTVVL